jgi:hypothetical protein
MSSFVVRLPTPPNGVSYRTCARPVVFHEVPEPVDVLSVDLAVQQFGNCFRVVIRVAYGEVQVGGEAAGVAGVQLCGGRSLP